MRALKEFKRRDSKAFVWWGENARVVLEGGEFSREGDGRRVHDDVEEGVGCTCIFGDLVREPEAVWTDGFLLGFVVVGVEDEAEDYAMRGTEIRVSGGGFSGGSGRAYLTRAKDSSSRP